MEEVSRLVRLVSVRGQKVIPLLDLDTAKTNKEKALFQKVQNGECQDDKEAAETLYGTTPDDARFKMLKMRLKKKLLNHLFFLDFTNNRFKVSYRHEQECLNTIHQVRILILNGEYQIAERLLNSALKISVDCEFTYITVTCLELLVVVSSETGNAKSFYATKETLTKYRTLAAYEHEAEDLFYVAKLELNKSIQSRKSFFGQLQSTLKRLRELWTLSQSYNIFDYYYMLTIWFHELTGEFTEIISMATESEQLLKDNSINEKRFDHRYNKYINVYAHLRARSFRNGLELAEQYLDDFDRSTNNWFAFMENYFLLALHAKKYDLALRLYKTVVENDFFQKINRLASERWTLYRTYLYFVNPSAELLKQFSIRDLLTAVPEYGKDKQGYNVAILIIQLMYYLREKDLEALVYRIGYLRKYMGTHLKDSFSDRSRLFFKLLLLTVREQLDPEGCRKKGKGIYEKLQNTPPPGDAYAETEIIPYEHLWDLAIQTLEKK
jgi:hypothetical protein